MAAPDRHDQRGDLLTHGVRGHVGYDRVLAQLDEYGHRPLRTAADAARPA
ncbi:hypothetical protein [Streptomyces decoyicus]|nr:hypothetical protein [Streptomyces decoyicus]QZY17647.1 hypothetical protein K7C20_22350 [Streptomyces decoyicus]